MTPRLRTRVAALRKELGVVEVSPFCHPECDGEGYGELEHLVHELAHALVLRLPLPPGCILELSVGDALQNLCRREQAHQEACVWVTEFEVFQMLDLPGLCWDTCLGEGIVQEGVTLDLMELTRDRWTGELKKHAEIIFGMLVPEPEKRP